LGLAKGDKMEDKKKLASQFAFIHECLVQKQQYFVNEFDIAKDSIRTITELFNKLNDEIKAEEASKESNEAPKAE